MTIVSTTSRISYVGNGVTVSFAVPWRMLDPTFVLVQKVVTATGVATTLVLNTDYTVTGALSPAGVVTTTVAPLATETLVIAVNVPLTQNADYVPGDEFPAETHEAALDKLTLIAQQLGLAAGRNVRAPQADTSIIELPAAAARANRYLRFDASGNPSVVDSQVGTLYYGSAAADPTSRPDSSTMQVGDIYFSTASSAMRVYSGSVWQDVVPSATSVFANYTETSTTAKTTFTITGGYTPGTVLVFLNGVLLEPTEYTASNGTTVVLGAVCAINDEFRLIGFNSFSVADTLARTSNLSDVPDKAAARTNLEIPTNFVAKAGDTVAGNLTVNGTLSSPTVVGTSYNAGPLGGFRNRIINGRFEVAQRGTSGTVALTSTYNADRWTAIATGATLTWQLIAGGPTGLGEYVGQYLRIFGAAGNTFFRLLQRVEHLNARDLWGKTVTISAYILQESGATRNALISAFAPTVVNNYASTVALGSNGTGTPCLNAQWTRVSWTLALPSSNVDLGLSFDFDLGGGLTAGQTFSIANVQLELGDRATPVEFRHFSTEQQLCRRYYRTHQFWVPATTAQNIGVIDMRATPTITGGGTGFNSTGTVASQLIAFQTTGALQTLILDAEI